MAMFADQTALVLFSGGQDSTVCLAWALERFGHVETIGFSYGQRHHVELDCRQEVLRKFRTQFPQWAERLGEDRVIDAGVLKELGDTALTSDAEIKMTEAGLPNTFVPGRNILFLTLAGALAYRRGIRHLVAGMCQTDDAGYPDCRDETIKATQLALQLGLDTRLDVHTPLMWTDKKATWQLAHKLAGDELVELIIEHTHTCYKGDRSQRHEWGYGCGACPACELRAKGYAAYRLSL